MSVVVVGGDNLGGIKTKLIEMGATELIHVPGRKKLDGKRMALNNRTSFVLVLTDFVNHDIMARVKEQAKACCIPMVFAKRSWSAVEQKIREGGWINE